MFEKMFTTKMSMDKKKLQNRFSKIRSKTGYKWKITGIALFVIIITSVVGISLYVAVNKFKETDNNVKNELSVNSDIKLTYNGQIIKFENSPYAIDEVPQEGYIAYQTVYFPLEELCEKLNSECEINNNKAVIKIGDIEYEIETNKKLILYNTNGKGFEGIVYAPEKKNDIMYIPYEYIDRMWIYGNGYDISGSVLYKNEKMNFGIEIPLKWLGYYVTDETSENDDYIQFKNKGIAMKHNGAGTLFSVMKMPDSEIDEYMNMVGNQTVVWRNNEYGYIIGRPTDVQIPVWEGTDDEDAVLCEEYEIMYKDISHIQTTFSLINKVEEYVIPNAENLSYAQIKDLQRQVTNGHLPWRMDYKQVVKSFLYGKGIDAENGEVRVLAGGSDMISLTYCVGAKQYDIELFKPIDKTDSGIWIVRDFKGNGAEVLKEISFFDCTPSQARIEKQDDGWYRIPQIIDVSFPWFESGNIHYPTCVTAYCAPTGTQMEEYKKEVGKITAPYNYTTMANVLSMRIQFPDDTTTSHLWFVFDFEDGTSETSEIYNVFADFSTWAYKENTEGELFLMSDDVTFRLNTGISTIAKQPVSETEGSGDGFHWKEYSYDDVFVKALLGDDNSTQIIRISTTSGKYKTPRDISVGDSVKN